MDDMVYFLRRRVFVVVWRERQKGDYDILCDDGVYEFVGEFLM